MAMALSVCERRVLEAALQLYIEGRTVCGCLGCPYEYRQTQVEPPCTISDHCKSERPCEIGWEQWLIEEAEWRLRGPFDVVVCGCCGMMAFRSEHLPIITYQCGHCDSLFADRHGYHKPEGGWFLADFERELGQVYTERPQRLPSLEETYRGIPPPPEGTM